MAQKDWWEDMSPGDCLKDGTWEDMVDYIQHSACTDFTIYSQCTDTNPAFKFGGNNDIEFDGDRAIMIDDGETYIGHGAGDGATGHDNTALGRNAIGSICTGNFNVGLGGYVMATAVSGTYNVGVGYNTMAKLTSGDQNVAIGGSALNDLTTGSNNTAMGYMAGRDVAVGVSNCVLLGYAAGQNNTQNNIIAIGYQALLNNTTGVDNTAMGSAAMDANVTGHRNTAVGKNTLGANAGGNNNAAFGKDALSSNVDQNDNTAIGHGAGGGAAASGCVYAGMSAGYNNATDNRLYINNSDSVFPLIYGEFDNDKVKFGDNDADWFMQFEHTSDDSYIYGANTTGHDLTITANSVDTGAYIHLEGNAYCTINGTAFYFNNGATGVFSFDLAGTDSVIGTQSDNKDLFLSPHGNGLVKFGTYAAKGAEAFAGFITMKDDAGNSRKVMICA